MEKYEEALKLCKQLSKEKKEKLAVELLASNIETDLFDTNKITKVTIQITNEVVESALKIVASTIDILDDVGMLKKG